jgi:hypothetical protein
MPAGDVDMSMGGPMAGEHGAAMVALLFLPVALMAALTLVEGAARSGSAAAVRLRLTLQETPAPVRLALLGMLVSAAVHLGLAPGHLAEDPVLGALFVLDGAALVAVAAWSLARPGAFWRVAGAVLLLAGVLAYAGYVVTGAEPADAVGVATKVVELAALGLLALPGRLAAPLPSRHFGGQTR